MQKEQICVQNGHKKYFPSIDREILFEKIRRKIKCRDTLWLIKTIIDGSNRQEEVNDYFSGDGLFTPHERKKGIPIGNLTSQFFANIYLDGLDHFIKERPKCRYYIRYVDDLTIFDNDKKRLWDIKAQIEAFLEKDRLNPHPDKTFVATAHIGIDHLGYRIFTTHRLLRKDNSLRFARKFKMLMRLFRQKQIPFEKLNSSIQSWLGHAKHADSWGLRKSVFGMRDSTL